MKFPQFAFIVLFFAGNPCFAQTDPEKPEKEKSKFQTGVYVGSFFANKYTAALYDGYGYDAEGNKNTFFNSQDINQSCFMYRKIVLEYGGYSNPQNDQVAAALGVNHGEWSFDQSDMPAGMKYMPAVIVGLQLAYSATKKDAILLNINSTKLLATGNFTIVINTTTIGATTPGYQNIKTFSITGAEQRLMIQPGYRRILGDDESFNFFIEGGPSLNMTKYLRNDIAINNLAMDLSSYYTQPAYPTYRAKYLRGNGLGAFTGLGVNLAANPNWSLQLLYSASFEKINIGEASKFSLQHAIGGRAFYTL